MLSFDYRCPTDPTTKFTATDNYRQRFNIQAFRFLQNSTAVFLHCLVFLCHKSSTDSRCRYGCTGNNVYRGKREVSSAENNEPSKMYLLEMEIRRLGELPSFSFIKSSLVAYFVRRQVTAAAIIRYRI